MSVEQFADERGVVVARRLTCVHIDAVTRILGCCTQGEHRLRSGFTTLGLSFERDAATASRTAHGSNVAVWAQKNPRAEARGESNRVTLRCNSETTCSFHLVVWSRWVHQCAPRLRRKARTAWPPLVTRVEENDETYCEMKRINTVEIC